MKCSHRAQGLPRSVAMNVSNTIRVCREHTARTTPNTSASISDVITTASGFGRLITIERTAARSAHAISSGYTRSSSPARVA